jgi:hypothetical protein
MEFVWYFVLSKWWDRKISIVNSIPMKILRKPYSPKEPLEVNTDSNVLDLISTKRM